MKIILTDEELSTLIRNTYAPPPDYRITDVAVSKYSSAFCTITLERDEPAPIVHEGEEAALRA